MRSIATVLAFAEATSPGPFLQFVPLILIFGIFYFLLVAPMRKRQKAQQQLIADLKKGDKVITTGGLHGEITSVQGELLIVKLADNLKVKISKSAVSGLQGSAEDANPKG